MSSIRISPRHIGKMKSSSFCPQCFWYQIVTGFRPPFESPMPGIMYNLDRFEKLIVEAHFKDKGTAPRWLKELGCTEVVGFPAKLTMEFPALELTMVGMPDAVFRKKDGSLYLVDYKTAKHKGDEDPFMPCYETQLLGYAELLENAGLGDVTSAALVYFENQVAAYSEEPLSLLSTDGFNVPLAVKIHPVELDRKTLKPLLKAFREYADMTCPPEGRSGCKDCKRLDQLFDVEMRLQKSGEYLKTADAYQRSVVFDYRLRHHQEHVISLSRQWETELESRGTDSFDSVPAPWDI